MGGLEGLADVPRDPEGLRNGNRALREAFGKRLPLQELHAEVRHALVGADVEDRADRRVREPGDRPRFPLEPFPHLVVRRILRREDLDGDVAAEMGVPRAIDLLHPARADGRDELVRPEAGTGGEGHQRLDCGDDSDLISETVPNAAAGGEPT